MLIFEVANLQNQIEINKFPITNDKFLKFELIKNQFYNLISIKYFYHKLTLINIMN